MNGTRFSIMEDKVSWSWMDDEIQDNGHIYQLKYHEIYWKSWAEDFMCCTR